MVAEKKKPEVDPSKMPMMRHLHEMRDRVLRSVIAIVIAVGIAFVFTPQIIEILKAPAGDVNLQAIELVEKLAVYIKVALAAAIIIAMPFLVYQLFGFVAPAMTRKEKGYILKILPFIIFMFLAGVSFAYFIALPPTLRFLINFMPELAVTTPRLSDYVNVVTRLIVSVGLVFETPIIIMFLARMGLVSPQWLAKRRKIWIVLAFVLSAFITPTIDPIIQTVIAFPLILLLELSIILSRFVYKKNEPVLAEADLPANPPKD
ncbi:twin-arginine translocase subunit TatC [Chloroflexota bacterium]